MDHDRVTIQSSSVSCGVGQLARVSSEIDDVLYAIATSLYHPARGNPVAFFMASDIFDISIVTNTDQLMKTAMRYNFGDVTQSAPEDNPKTGNTIVVYVWKINHIPFKDWYANERVKRLRKVGV